jgi:hypothetical protein
MSAVAPDDVWAVGPFDEDASNSSAQALHWNGRTWRHVAMQNLLDPTSNLNEIVAVSGTASDDVWAAGYAIGAQGSAQAGVRPFIEHWDGSAWKLVPIPGGLAGQRLNAVAAISPVDAWAVGDGPVLLHWNGTTWTAVPSPDVIEPRGGAVLTGIAATGSNDVWAVGATAGHSLIEHWDGVKWSVVPSPGRPGSKNGFVHLTAVVATSANDAWATGYEAGEGYWSFPGQRDISAVESRPLFLHWDGSAWAEAPAPDTGKQPSYLPWALAARSSNDVWVAGARYVVGERRYVPWVAHWDGRRWSDAKRVPSAGQTSVRLRTASVVTGTIWMAGGASASPVPGGATRPFLLTGRCG